MGFIAHNTASWGFGWCITCNGRQDHSHFFSDVTLNLGDRIILYLILFYFIVLWTQIFYIAAKKGSCTK